MSIRPGSAGLVVAALALWLMADASPVDGQDAELDRVQSMIEGGRFASARGDLQTWLDANGGAAERTARQQALWLRALLTVDPGMAELDYRRLVVEYPGGRHSDEALLRLAQIARARADDPVARRYLETLIRDYPGSPQRVEARSMLAEIEESPSSGRRAPDGVDEPARVAAGPAASSADDPDPTTADEPGPAAADDPDPTTVDEPEPAAVDDPDPTTVDEPEPASADDPDPAGVNEPDPEPGSVGEPAAGVAGSPPVDGTRGPGPDIAEIEPDPTSDVVPGPPPSASDAPGVEEPEPTGADPADPPVETPRDPSPRAAPDPPESATFAVQIGAFSQASGARTIAERAEAADVPVRLVRVQGSDLIRVRTGAFVDRDSAEARAREVRAAGLDAVVSSDRQSESEYSGP